MFVDTPITHFFMNKPRRHSLPMQERAPSGAYKMKILPLRKDCILDNANTIWICIKNPLALKCQITTNDSS